MKRILRRRFFAGFLIVGLLLTMPIYAGADDAKQKYQEGVSLFEKKEFKDAAAAFRAAYEMKPSWKVLYNVAQSEAAAKRHGLALEAFETYLSEGGDDVQDTRREEVLSEVERLRKMVGSIEVTAPDGAIVFVDGVDRGTAPLLGRLPVAASVRHVVWAEAGGQKFAERPFKVMGGSSIHVDLKPKEEPTPAVVSIEKETQEAPEEAAPKEDTATSPVQKSKSKLPIIGWVSVGLGVAMIATGAVTGGMAMGVDGDLSDTCEGPDNEDCHSDKQDDIDKLNTLALTTDVLLFAGGAVAATGIVLLIVDKVRGKDEEASSVALAPAISPGFTGAVIKGSF